MFKGQQNVMKNRLCYSGSAEEPYALCGSYGTVGGAGSNPCFYPEPDFLRSQVTSMLSSSFRVGWQARFVSLFGDSGSGNWLRASRNRWRVSGLDENFFGQSSLDAFRINNIINNPVVQVGCKKAIARRLVCSIDKNREFSC